MNDPIRMTAKMLDIRDTMRNLFGDQYPARIEPFREAIRRWMRSTGKGVMECGLAACRVAEKHGNEMDVPLAISATVEECQEKLWMVENDVPAEILQSGCHPCAEVDRGVEIDVELIAEWEYAKQR